MYQMKGAFGPELAGPPQQRPPHLHPPPSMHETGMTSGMSPTSPTPSAAKNLSVSPNAADQHRVPSPQEMAIHAQQIMQNALIKRKLEEQKENYRRRHEHEQMRVKAGTESPHLAFTPTVVMKKMAADRRDSDPKPVIPELKVSTSDKVSCNMINQMPPGPPPPQRTSPPNMLTSQQHQMLLMHQHQQQQQQQAQQIQAQQIAAAMQVCSIILKKIV